MVFFQFAEQRTLGVLFSSFLLAALASCAGDRESTQRYQVDVLGQPVPVGAPTEFTVKLISRRLHREASAGREDYQRSRRNDAPSFCARRFGRWRDEDYDG